MPDGITAMTAKLVPAPLRRFTFAVARILPFVVRAWWTVPIVAPSSAATRGASGSPSSPTSPALSSPSSPAVPVAPYVVSPSPPAVSGVAPQPWSTTIVRAANSRAKRRAGSDRIARPSSKTRAVVARGLAHIGAAARTNSDGEKNTLRAARLRPFGDHLRHAPRDASRRLRDLGRGGSRYGAVRHPRAAPYEDHRWSRCRPARRPPPLSKRFTKRRWRITSEHGSDRRLPAHRPASARPPGSSGVADRRGRRRSRTRSATRRAPRHRRPRASSRDGAAGAGTSVASGRRRATPKGR